MIDLHMHSIYSISDGEFDEIEILKKAKELGLDCISITDHDSVAIYDSLKKVNIQQYYSGKIIKGCECTTSFNNELIEILGYNVDTESMKKFFAQKYSPENKLKIRERNIMKMRKVIDNAKLICLHEGYPINSPEHEVLLVYRELISHEENKDFFGGEKWPTINEFYRNYLCNKDNCLFINLAENFPSASEVIDQIHTAGGVAFLAHLFVYSFENKMTFLNDIVKNTDLDGLECYYSAFNQAQSNLLIDYCKHNKLFMSGGTDFHGPKIRKGVEMGIGKGDMCIPNSIVSEWAEKTTPHLDTLSYI